MLRLRARVLHQRDNEPLDLVILEILFNDSLGALSFHLGFNRVQFDFAIRLALID
jgi:hypothetical protein